MNTPVEWIDIGAADDFKRTALREAKLGDRLVAVSFKDGKFGVISNVCNHVGGPLGKGVLEGEMVVCPWHQYRFHRCTGEGEPGYEADKVPGYGVKEENGRLLVTAKPTSRRGHLPHDPHPLTRATERAPGRPGRAARSECHCHRSQGRSALRYPGPGSPRQAGGRWRVQYRLPNSPPWH